MLTTIGCQDSGAKFKTKVKNVYKRNKEEKQKKCDYCLSVNINVNDNNSAKEKFIS